MLVTVIRTVSPRFLRNTHRTRREWKEPVGISKEVAPDARDQCRAAIASSKVLVRLVPAICIAAAGTAFVSRIRRTSSTSGMVKPMLSVARSSEFINRIAGASPA